MSRTRFRSFVLAASLVCAFMFAYGGLAQQTGANSNSVPASNQAATAALEPRPTGSSTVSVADTESSSILNAIDLDSTSINDLPDDPVQQNPLPTRRPQTKRILGIIPNFRSVSTDEKLPAQTTREKFMTATQDSFDYSSVLLPILLAGYGLGTNATPEFGEGMSGYGQYLWHSAVDQTTENYFVEFVFPALTRQDSRYYTLGRGGFFKRTGYSLSRAVITRTDSGNNTFNISEIVGAGASAGLSATYYPASQRTFAHVADQWGLNVGIDAATFFLHEFWPDINHKFFHYEEPAQ